MTDAQKKVLALIMNADDLKMIFTYNLCSLLPQGGQLSDVWLVLMATDRQVLEAMKMTVGEHPPDGNTPPELLEAVARLTSDLETIEKLTQLCAEAMRSLRKTEANKIRHNKIKEAFRKLTGIET